MNPQFFPGLKLSEMFFHEIVKEIIEKKYPDLKYTAALIGPGSEVLGYDDIVSSDHHWGLRLQIFLSAEDYENYSEKLFKLFQTDLPYDFKGYSTNWTEPDPEDMGTQMPNFTNEGIINHRIDVTTVDKYLKEKLAVEELNLSDMDWLLLPEQSLLEFTSGKIFYDTLGDLSEARKYLAYFPDNVWKYKIKSEWEHIGQEFAFAGRTGERGDELGSKLEVSRLVRYVMRLAFLLSKEYIPYQKWFGTAFSNLKISEKLEEILLKVLKEEDWKERDKLLCEAYLFLVEAQNKLKITPKIFVEPISYFSRNMTVIDVKRIFKELDKVIEPPLDTLDPIGSVDQFLEISGGLCAHLAKKSKKLYEK